MSTLRSALAAAALSIVSLIPAGFATAADLPLKAAKPVADLPFFLLIDDRVSYSYQFTATAPGNFIVNPNGTLNGNTAKQVYTFTHFDVWAYGTNFFNIDMLKSDHTDPAVGCNLGQNTGCAGATEFYGFFRSTFGWNEIFHTKAFSMGPLHNISFEIGADGESDNNANAAAKRDFVAGLQFAFDLPYKGFFNVTPLAYKEINHSAFTECAAGGVPGVTCLSSGNTEFNTTWAVETNYYMDLGFLPENFQYFAISGRAAWYGPKGNQNAPLGIAGGGVATKTELNSEPIRLTFDASKAIWGPKYAQFVTTWVAYRYWENKFGLDASNPANLTCFTAGGVNNRTCTEKSLDAGITVKF
jgi:hypothetical protein